MLNTYIDLHTVEDGTGKVIYIQPQFHIQVGVNDNFDIKELKELEENVQTLLQNGLNRALKIQ